MSMRYRYPALNAYGSKHKFLTEEEAVSASAEERIRSIWPFLVKRILSFVATLSPRDRVNFDADDVLVELWISLRENDAEWIPDRGKYITFAGSIVERELCAIRDRARTVESPRNSSCRMKEYAKEEAAGVLTERRARTAADIKRTSDGIKAIGNTYDDVRIDHLEDADTIAERNEEIEESRGIISVAIAKALTVEEAGVLGRLSGLWGREGASAWRIAFETGRELSEVNRIAARARKKLKDYLAANT